MIDDCLLSLVYAAWLAASTMPLGLMLGAPCSPCCGCVVADGKPRTDPKEEGTWVPSGTWRDAGGVTWSFTANPGDESGETWFFYGSASTSRVGGGATLIEREDWGNICNWYSNKTTSPSTLSSLVASLDKRAKRLPPNDAVVHVYTSVSTTRTGPQTVKNIYFWGAFTIFRVGSEITASSSAHDSAGGCVFDSSRNDGTVNGGATLNGFSFFTFAENSLNGIINGGATFNGFAFNTGSAVVNDGATFNESSQNGGTTNGGGTFNNSSLNSGTVNDGATFNDNSVNGNVATTNGGGTFSDNSRNSGTINGGGTFNNNSTNEIFATVNGGATFNDAACSSRTTGSFFATPCTRKFVAHPTDLPTCNGTAPAGCDNSADTCGCG